MNTWRYRLPIVAVLLGVVLAAGPIVAGATDPSTPESKGQEAMETPESPGEVFQRVESRLRAGNLNVKVRLRARGAVNAYLEGTALARPDNHVHLSLAGDYKGEKTNAELISDGQDMRLRKNKKAHTSKTPTALSESLILGFMRMGLMHNAARLVEGEPPDHAQGGAGDWTKADNFRLVGTQSAPRLGKVMRIDFDVLVGGQKRGEGSLYVPARSRLPSQRVQTIHFPEGDLQVLEKYEWQRAPKFPIEDAAFDLKQPSPTAS